MLHSFSARILKSNARLIISVGVLVVIVFAIDFLSSDHPFTSVEVKFTDASPHGVAIVPASCPSDPHYPGECGGSCVSNVGEGCSASNSCGGSSSGNIQCDGSCSAGAPACPPPPPPPSVNTSNGTYNVNGSLSVLEGDTITLGWSCPGGTTVSSSNFASGGSQSGSVSVPIMNATSYYYICSGSAGSSQNSVTVGTLAPQINNFDSRPHLVRKGDSTVLTWDSSYTKSCAVRGSDGSSWSGLNGNVTTGKIQGQTLYTVTCSGLVRSVESSQTVSVAPTYQEQ